MKKYLFLLLVILLCCVSCNLDSDEGLFHRAGNSQPKESYMIYRIVGKKDANNFYVSSDKGILETTMSSSGKISIDNSKAPRFNGNIAKVTLFADADGIIYSENNAICYMDNNGNHSTKEDHYSLNGFPYSSNGTDFSYILKNTEDGSFKTVTLSSPTMSSFDALPLTPVSVADVKGLDIINNDVFVAKQVSPSGTLSYTLLDHGVETSLGNQTNYWGLCNGYYIDQNGNIGAVGGSVVFSKIDTITNTVASFTDSTRTIFIPSYSNKVYSADRTIYTVSGLNSVHVISIVSHDTVEDTYTILTSNSGFKTLKLGEKPSLD